MEELTTPIDWKEDAIARARRVQAQEEAAWLAKRGGDLETALARFELVGRKPYFAMLSKPPVGVLRLIHQGLSANTHSALGQVCCAALAPTTSQPHL